MGAWIVRILSLVALAALLSAPGCARREPSGGNGRIVVRYWEKWTGAEAESMQRLVEKFNTSQDRIEVRFSSIGQLDKKLLLAISGGNAPDLTGMRSHEIYTYAEMGALTPLDEPMRRDGVRRADYIDSLIGLCEYRGFTWALPVTPATLALHYNRDLFRKAGLDPDHPPRTTQELIEYADRLTVRDEKGRLVQMGILPNDPGWWNDRWGLFFGGQLLDAQGRATADSAENIAAYEWVRSIPARYGLDEVQKFAAPGAGQFASPQNLFLSGKVAMTLQGVWMSKFIDDYGANMDWGVAPFPTPQGIDPPVTLVESDVLVIPKGSPHPGAAWEFIRFVERQENLEAICLAQRKFTPLAQVSAEFYAHHPNPKIQVFRELARSPRAASVPKMPLYPEYADEMFNVFDLVWRGRAEPKEALARVRGRIQPRLDRVQREWELTSAQRLQEWATP